MKIVIDLQGAQSGSRWRGIGRYSLALAETLTRIRGNHEIVIALSDAFPETLVPLRNFFEPLVGSKNIRVWSAPLPVRGNKPSNAKRRAWAETIRDAFLASLNPDIILVTSLFEGHGDDAVTNVKCLDFGVPVAVILYDLIPLHDPKRYLKPVPTWEKLYREKLEALSRADLLLAISEYSAVDASKYIRKDGQQIVNISAACNKVFRPSQMRQSSRVNLRARLGIDRPYIITSGTIEPHKNLSNLFSAFSRLPALLRDGYKIVLIGHVNDGQKKILLNMTKAAGLPGDFLVVTGYVDDDDLVVLYSDAELMVFPSSDEGFGLPPLEAMSCGTPTIGSNVSSIPEVIGLAEAQFDPKDIKGLAKLITRALTDTLFRKTLSENAKVRSKAFSWEKTANTALRAMEEIVASRGTGYVSALRPLDACIEVLSTSLPDKYERNELAAALALDFPKPDRKPCLFVDVSELRLRDARTGCQRVTRSILKEWLETPPAGFEVIPVYATTETLGYFYAFDYLAAFTGTQPRGPDGLIDYARGDVFFGLDLQPVIVAAQKPFLQLMRRRGVITRFFVHDLLPVLMPQHFPAGTEKAFQSWLETLLVSDGIIGNSRSTVDAFRAWQADRSLEAEGHFGYDYVHLGADLKNSLPTKGMPLDAQDVLTSFSQRPTFLMVGTLEPRKGHTQTLDAFETLWSQGIDINLAIVGKEGWNVELLAKRLRSHPERKKRLFWLEGISDEYLTKVYSAATCLLAASEGEGFGLPLIEAAQAGLPILARDIEVFREVGESDATYFDAQKSDDLAASISAWLYAYREGSARASTGLKWLTWAECAAELGWIVTCAPRPEQPDFIVTESITGFQPSRKRILISKLDHMGDLLLAIPAISRLRSRYPKARLDVLVGSWNEVAAQQLGLFDTIYTYDFFKQKSSFAPSRRATEVAELQNRIGHCDMVIDLRRQPDSRFIIAGIQSPLRIGYQTGIAEVDSQLGIALPHWNDIPFKKTPLNQTHISKQMLALVDAIPSEIDDYIVLPPFLSDLSKRRQRAVALFPKAGNDIKEWGDANFLELAIALADSKNIESVNCYFSSIAEAEAAGFVDENKIRVQAGLSFSDLIRSVAQNLVCVANNSFGAHIASYLGVETVGIYGGHETSAEWAPFFGRNTVIRKPVPCSPCHLGAAADCMHALRCLDIPVDLVHRQVMIAFKRSETIIGER